MMLFFVIAGCSWKTPYPPPTAFPDAAAPLAAGARAGVVGTSVLIDPNDGLIYWPEDSLGGRLNPLGGRVVGGFGLGLTEQLDLRLSAGPIYRGGTAGAQLGWTLLERDALSVGLIGGSGVAFSEGFAQRATGQTDEDGEAITGAADFVYASVAPTLGGRLHWQAAPKIAVTGLARLSYSVMIPLDDQTEAAAPVPWLEASGGVMLGIPGRFRLGLHLGMLTGRFDGDVGRALSPGLSVSRGLTTD